MRNPWSHFANNVTVRNTECKLLFCCREKTPQSNFKVEINPQRVSVVVTKADKIKEETLVWIIKQCWSEGSQRVWRSLKVGVANKQVVVWTSRPLCFIIQWKVWTLAIPFSDFSGLIILFLNTPYLIKADACRASTCAVCWPQTFSCPSVILLRKKLKLTFQKIWTKDPQWVFKTWQLSKTPHCAPMKLCHNSRSTKLSVCWQLLRWWNAQQSALSINEHTINPVAASRNQRTVGVSLRLFFRFLSSIFADMLKLSKAAVRSCNNHVAELFVSQTS